MSTERYTFNTLHNYTVEMESGHVYFVIAESPEGAMREAERQARNLHGVADAAVSVEA